MKRLLSSLLMLLNLPCPCLSSDATQHDCKDQPILIVKTAKPDDPIKPFLAEVRQGKDAAAISDNSKASQHFQKAFFLCKSFSDANKKQCMPIISLDYFLWKTLNFGIDGAKEAEREIASNPYASASLGEIDSWLVLNHTLSRETFPKALGEAGLTQATRKNSIDNYIKIKVVS